MKKVKVEKILGYLLLVAGLGIIVYSSFNVINVFKGKVQPYQVFSFSSIGFDLSGLAAGQPIPQDADLKQEVDADLINKPANITAHVFLMGFIASAGFKIAQIGVMLIRSIKVNLLRKGDVEVQK